MIKNSMHDEQDFGNGYVRQREFDAHVRCMNLAIEDLKKDASDASKSAKELSDVCSKINLSLTRLEDRQDLVIKLCRWMTSAAIGALGMHLPAIIKYLSTLF